MEHKSFVRSLLFATLTIAALEGFAQDPAKSELKPDEAVAIATDAYIYGYPLMTMDMTRRVMTNVPKAEGKLAPMGVFANLRDYPSPSDKEVTAPNADTLYSLAWLDVTKEPWVLSIPDAKDRYYLMPMLDGWTDVFQVPGKRTTGTKPQSYLITGPGWKGDVPEGMTQYKSPTGMVWILGRTYCTGTPEDFQKVHEFQDGLSLVPLSSYGKTYSPPEGKTDPSVNMKTPVRDQVNALSTSEYFKRLASLMKDNPPNGDDALIVSRMAKIGIVPGQDFDMSKLNTDLIAAMADVPKAAQKKIMGHLEGAGQKANGWTYTTNAGTYGNDYLQRAYITAVGLGANRPQDAVYPMSEGDADGKPYTGANKYVMHFDKGQTPPARAFWSLTMYDKNMFFVPNALNRYNLNSRDQFKFNEDGSLDLYIQKDSPGKDKEANWLPAPEGQFNLMLRLYWPNETAPSILDGTWKPPVVKTVKAKPEM